MAARPLCTTGLTCSALFLTFAAQGQVLTLQKTVDGKSGPWLVTDTLNTGFTFGFNDQAAPLFVSSSDGYDFTAGGSFSIDYVSGLTSPFGGDPYADGVGDTGYNASGNGGSSGNFFPSKYMTADYPVYLNALVATFADDNGAIVGTPFLVGNSVTKTVPDGATRLQFGFNDDIFSDNTGALTITIAGPQAQAPAPGGVLTALIGAIPSATVLLRRRSKGSAESRK